MRRKLALLISAACLTSCFPGNGDDESSDRYVDYGGQQPPGMKARVFAEGVVSTEFGELNAVLTSDLSEFYFTRRGVPGRPPAIMVARNESGVWTSPEELDFDDRYSAIDLFLTSDGLRMVFCSNRPHDGDDAPRDDHDFWVSRRVGERWSEPVLFAPLALSPSEDFYPIVTRSGNLYLNSQREGPGTNNIYRSTWSGEEYLPAEQLPAPINSEFREFDAFVSQAEDMIIFTSMRPGGFGGADIYVSVLEDGEWSAPRNLGAEVNSEGAEFGAMLSPDGQYLFFTSTRNVSEDIFWISASVVDGN